MKILSIDTSSDVCSIAILEDNNLIKEYSQNTGHTHSETLMPNIQNIFKETSLNLNDIDLIVCDKGPGSFTGIRIGVATAMAFSDSLNIKAIGISSLEALAYNVENNGLICSMIDAKNDNVYVGLFEKNADSYILKRELSAESLESILNELKNVQKTITFVGDGSLAYKEKIKTNLSNIEFAEKNNLSSYRLGLAGLDHFNKNENPGLLPLYLRKPQAERMLELKGKE